MRRESRQVNFAHIGVIAVGDGGTNSINRLLNQDVYSVDFIAANTSIKGLQRSMATKRLLLGEKVTNGQGTGSDPHHGEHAAYASWGLIEKAIKPYDMLFITACMGGGTGSGATPVIAQVAKRLGILTIAIVTTPFEFEGKRTKDNAAEGIHRLRQFVDTLIVLPNDRLVELAENKMNTVDAFKVGDSILFRSIRVIEELISQPGLINVDFADVKTIMKEQGATLMTMGVAKGETRASEAAELAVSCPVLDMSIQGAKNVLVHIAASPDLNLFEVDEATDIVRQLATADANVIFGTTIDPLMLDEMRITVIATGFETQPHVSEYLNDPQTETEDEEKFEDFVETFFGGDESVLIENIDEPTFVWPTAGQMMLNMA